MSTRKINDQLDLMKGSLDLLVLQTLAAGRAHGHAIACSIERRSDEVLQVGHAEDGISENNRKARFYRLTSKGRKHLFAEASKWQKFSDAIARILAPVVGESS
jgi:PadR family transcriptional regulator PadR